MYRVTFDGINVLEFTFVDYGDAIGFVGFATECGSYKRYTTSNAEPVKALIEKVEVDE